MHSNKNFHQLLWNELNSISNEEGIDSIKLMNFVNNKNVSRETFIVDKWEDFFNSLVEDEKQYEKYPSWFRRTIGIVFEYYVLEVKKEYKKSYLISDIKNKIDAINTEKKIIYSITFRENNIYQKIKKGECDHIKRFFGEQKNWTGYWVYWDKKIKTKKINL